MKVFNVAVQLWFPSVEQARKAVGYLDPKGYRTSVHPQKNEVLLMVACPGNWVQPTFEELAFEPLSERFRGAGRLDVVPRIFGVAAAFIGAQRCERRERDGQHRAHRLKDIRRSVFAGQERTWVSRPFGRMR